MKRAIIIVLVIVSAALVVARLSGNHVDDRSRSFEAEGRHRLTDEQVAAIIKADTCKEQGLASEQYDQLLHDREEANERLKVNWRIMNEDDRNYWEDVSLADADKLGYGEDQEEDSGRWKRLAIVGAFAAVITALGFGAWSTNQVPADALLNKHLS